MIYQRVHSATMAIAQQHERMMEEMEKSSQVCPCIAATPAVPGREAEGCAGVSHVQTKKQNSVSEETFAEKLIKTHRSSSTVSAWSLPDDTPWIWPPLPFFLFAPPPPPSPHHHQYSLCMEACLLFDEP